MLDAANVLRDGGFGGYFRSRCTTKTLPSLPEVQQLDYHMSQLMASEQVLGH